MNIKSILYSILLIAFFVATSILAISATKKLAVSHTHSTDNPDFFMNNVVCKKFNQEGHVNDKIETEKITHFVKENTYLFENPTITLYKKNEQPWNITAKHGRSKKGKTKIYLWDDVKIMRDKSPKNSDFDVTTEDLTIYPDTKYAETKSPLTILQSNNTIKAIGAELNFKEGTLKLLSDVRSWYHVE